MLEFAILFGRADNLLYILLVGYWVIIKIKSYLLMNKHVTYKSKNIKFISA